MKIITLCLVSLVCLPAAFADAGDTSQPTDKGDLQLKLDSTLANSLFQKGTPAGDIFVSEDKYNGTFHARDLYYNGNLVRCESPVAAQPMMATEYLKIQIQKHFTTTAHCVLPGQDSLQALPAAVKPKSQSCQPQPPSADQISEAVRGALQPGEGPAN